jgi:hypothetical protein
MISINYLLVYIYWYLLVPKISHESSINVQEPGDLLFVPEGWGHATILESYAATRSTTWGKIFVETAGLWMSLVIGLNVWQFQLLSYESYESYKSYGFSISQDFILYLEDGPLPILPRQ